MKEEKKKVKMVKFILHVNMFQLIDSSVDAAL